MKPRGFPGEFPSLVAKFLRLAGVAAVLSNVEFVGRSGAFNPLFESSLVPLFIKQYTKNILMIMIMVGSASYSLVERRSDDGGRPNGRPTHKIRWIFLKPIKKTPQQGEGVKKTPLEPLAWQFLHFLYIY